MGSVLIFLGILVFSAHLFSMIFSKKKIPDVLLLLVIGVLIGPVLGFVTPEDFGSVGSVFTSITLVVILFEGGTGISISDLKNSWRSTVNLTASSFVISAVAVAAIAYAFGNDLLNSITLGCILAGTSSAVVIPLAQHLKLSSETKTSLILESAITDVLCIVFAFAFMNAQLMGNGLNVGKVVGNVVSSFVLATLLGFIGAIVWSSLLQRIRQLRNSMFLTPAYLFIIYGLAVVLGYSGAIASLAFGITIANMEYFNFKFIEKYQKNRNLKLNDNENAFISEIGFVLKTFFFVYIGLSIPFSDFRCIMIGGLITLSLIVVRLIIAAFFSPKSSNGFDKSVIATMIPKGLAAAVLASVPEQLGIAGGEAIKYITFSVVFFSILLCSIMILLIEKYPRISIFLQFFFKGGNRAKKKATQNNKDLTAESEKQPQSTEEAQKTEE
ncbi:MAG: cation:proton antiporter [Bacteroidales bacterium]|nr:cation:proton antiporter [Bacteroidales bacterium]